MSGLAPELEGDGQAHLPVVGAGGSHVEHAFRAVHLLFDGQRDGALDHVGARAGVVGGDLHRRRCDRRELGDREQRNRDRAGQRDQDRHRRREDRPAHEERDEAGRSGARGLGARGDWAARQTIPGIRRTGRTPTAGTLHVPGAARTPD
jgi:hypothetical protein